MHKSKMHGLQYIILRQNYIISRKYRDSYCMRMQHPFLTNSTLTSHDSTSLASLDPTTPVSLDRSALSQQDLIPVPIMTAKSTSSLSVSFSSSTGVLCTTSLSQYKHLIEYVLQAWKHPLLKLYWGFCTLTSKWRRKHVTPASLWTELKFCRG